MQMPTIEKIKLAGREIGEKHGLRFAALYGSVAELASAAIFIFRLRQIRQSSPYFKSSMSPHSSFGSLEI
jgi:hypothetical protein